MTQSIQSAATGPEPWPAGAVSRYSISYGSPELHVVTEFSLKELFDRFGDILWEPGKHKYNVTFFIGDSKSCFWAGASAHSARTCSTNWSANFAPAVTATPPSIERWRR